MRPFIATLRHEPRITIPLVALIIGAQAWQMIPYLADHEEYPDYYDSILPYVVSCDASEPWHRDNYEVTRNALKWALHCWSWKYLHSPTILVSLFGIGMMPMIYLLGSSVTGDRLAGLISLLAFVYNPLYMDWATSGTYDMTWAFFVVLSVILIHKKGVLGPIFSILAAIAAKSMTILYLPAWFYSVSRSEQRYRLLGFAGGILGVTAFVFLAFFDIRVLVGNEIGFYPENIGMALVRNISLLWQVIPALMAAGGIAVYFRPKKSMRGKREAIVWMLWIIATTPIVHIFTQQLMFGYRMVVFAAFMSVFVSTVVIDVGNFIVGESYTKSLKFFIKD